MVFISFCIMMLGFGIIVIAINMYTGLLAGIEGNSPGPSIMRLHLGFSIGALLGPKSISFFITSGMNWRLIYILTAAVFSVISIFYLVFRDLNFSDSKNAGKLQKIQKIQKIPGAGIPLHPEKRK
jgi:MFS family permease